MTRTLNQQQNTMTHRLLACLQPSYEVECACGRGDTVEGGLAWNAALELHQSGWDTDANGQPRCPMCNAVLAKG